MALHYVKTQAKIGFGKEKETKYVGRRQLADPFTLERLAKEISHNNGQPQAAVEATLRTMVLAIEDAIKDGRSVELGDLGTLSPAISTIAAGDAKDVKIRKKRILFRASKKLRTIVEGISLKLISDEDDGTTDTDNDNDNNPSTDPDQGNSGTGSDNPGGNPSDDDLLTP